MNTFRKFTTPKGNPMPAPARPGGINTPAHARPESVQDAEDAHLRLMDEYDSLTDKLRQLETALVKTREADNDRDVELIESGKPPVAPGKRTAPAVEAELAEVERRRHMVSRAGARTRAKLAIAIRLAQQPWLGELGDLREQHAADFLDFVTAMEQAGRRLGTTQWNIRWLELVDGDVPQSVSSGQLYVRIGKVNYSLSDIAAALREAATPKPKPKDPILIGAEAEAAS
jgi:hypothetical protein